ncbi:MAG: transcriptional repressor NrdR [Ruminococcaceae bacterium]|nr:transcriptional repressor NrdR [Oscillospiraceae bacterium]
MKCPYCEYLESKVVDSRPAGDGSSIRRRRECPQCGRRFTTYEQVEVVPLVVIKKDGKRQAYNRQKLLNGVLRACEKTPVTLAQMEMLVMEVEVALHNRPEEGEVSSTIIGEMVMEKLKALNDIAYVRFASVYREFKDVSTFLEELQGLLGNKEK